MHIMAKIAEIIIDVETLEQTSLSASITGNIYWQIDDYFFPEQHWYDFVSPLLCWWSNSILEVLSGSCEKASLLYMDGPQQMIVKLNDEDTLLFECYDRYDSCTQKAPEYIFFVDKKKLLRRMILTMTRVVEWVYRQGCSLDVSLKGEIDQIKANSSKFKRILKTML
jgi:hypothetical protein